MDDSKTIDRWIEAMIAFDRGDGRADEIAKKYEIDMEQFWKLFAWYSNRRRSNEKIKV